MSEPRPHRLVIVDDEQMVLTTLRSLLNLETDYEVDTFTSARDALEHIETHPVSLVISDYLMPEMDGIEFLARVAELQPEAPRVVLTGYADKQNAIKAINEVGLFQFIEKPWDNDRLLLIIRNAIDRGDLVHELRARLEEIEALKEELERERDYLREEVKKAGAYGDIIGDSPALGEVMRQIEAVARTPASVLILGESGVGKELFARAIHERSDRAGQPLVKVNCAAVPKELFESEFFGHVKGAFTGALKPRVGRFQLADTGTLFLDEVGEIPLELQGKLLRVLQEQEFEAVGDDKTRRVDVRILAATNRDLKQEVDAGRFRQDLYYRLSVFPIEIPPLRDRREDILPLIHHFTEVSARKLKVRTPTLSPTQVDALRAYDWPGNIRELQNAVERGVILARGGELELAIPGLPAPSADQLLDPGQSDSPPRIISADEWRDLQRENIEAALERTGWKVGGDDGAAVLLGLKPTTLTSQMKALGIKRPISSS